MTGTVLITIFRIRKKAAKLSKLLPALSICFSNPTLTPHTIYKAVHPGQQTSQPRGRVRHERVCNHKAASWACFHLVSDKREVKCNHLLVWSKKTYLFLVVSLKHSKYISIKLERHKQWYKHVHTMSFRDYQEWSGIWNNTILNSFDKEILSLASSKWTKIP